MLKYAAAALSASSWKFQFARSATPFAAPPVREGRSPSEVRIGESWAAFAS